MALQFLKHRFYESHNFPSTLGGFFCWHKCKAQPRAVLPISLQRSQLLRHSEDSQPFMDLLLTCRGCTLNLTRGPLVMGIVNLSTDSFSGDGKPGVDAALGHAEHLLNDGAELIDVGAETARTNRPPIPVADEIALLAPFITRFC